MSQIPAPLTELEFKEQARDCFEHGEISEWSAHRGWKHRSSGSRALSWKDEQELALYEAYLDLYAARMVGAGLAAKLWGMFSRAVFPLVGARPAHPAATGSSNLAEAKLHFNNWAMLEHNREDGQAFLEECEAARRKAIDCLMNFKREGEERKSVYPARAHTSNLA